VNILNIDFERLYKEQKQNSSFKPKTKEEWNSKAEDLNSVVKNDSYINELLKLIDTSGCESLLDVGCGVGTVCINLKDSINSIIAIDYAANMLKKLEERIEEENARNITPKLLSWDDSWEDLPMFDLVVASRSMQVSSMRDALEKLNQKAKKRVYLTTKVGGSFLPQEIMDLLDKNITPNPDYIYIVNILYSMGINPALNYIELEDYRLSIEDEDRFVGSVEWSVGELSLSEKERIREFYKNRIHTLKQTIKWAVISWEK